MKKIFRLFAAFAALTMAFSCVEEANPEVGTENGGTSYDGPMITLTFDIDELETKTAWDGENHTWSEGDQIKIVYGTDANAYTVADVVDGKVTAEVGDVETYYAVYPAKTAHVLTESSDFSVTIPKVQNGTFADANIMAAMTSASEKVLAFKNLTHILKFDLSEGCEYNFFRFRSNSTGDDVRMGATASLVTFGDDDVTVGIPVNGGQTGYGCVSLDKNALGPFYFGIRAGTDLTGGFGVLASKSGKEGNFTGGLLSTTTLETTRSKITDLGTLDNYISDDWYITSKGQGSGKSWSDPAGISLLINLLKNRTSTGETYSGNGTTDIYRLIDARIHIAAGTYNIFEANGNANMNVAGLAYDATDRYKSTKITIIGGYPAEPVEGDIQDFSKAENATIFKANAEANSRIFRFENQPLGYLNFDGITFKGSGETAISSAGAGSYFTGEPTGVVTYRNCDFFDFNNSNSGSQGGAILLNNSSELIVNFEGCEFTNNTTTSNGTLAVMAAQTTVTLSTCKFSENVAAKEGGVFYVTNGVVNLNNCNFSNNGAGTLPAAQDEAPTEFGANRGGAIFVSGGKVHVNQCIFDDNYANIGADIAAINATPVVFVNRSVFKNGTAYANSSDGWRGKSIDTATTKGATLCLNNCIFCNNTSSYITQNTGLPCIKTNGDNAAVINTSFYDTSMRFIRQDNATSTYTANNVAKCDAEKRGLANVGTRKYNLVNSEYSSNDTNYGDLGNLIMSWTDDTNMLTWTLNESITIAKYATVKEISADLSTNFAEFDTWLNTIEDNPYGIDFYGNTRNAEKMNPGAWDSGL